MAWANVKMSDKQKKAFGEGIKGICKSKAGESPKWKDYCRKVNGG